VRADGGEFWLVLKHEDVVAISKQPETFATTAPLLADPLPKDLWPVFPGLGIIADNVMTFGAERHTLFRALAATLFSAARMAGAEHAARTICIEVIERARRRGVFDFAEDVALAVPVRVILGRLVGVATEDLTRVMRAVLTINAMDDPIFRPSGDALLGAADALRAQGEDVLRRVQAQPDDSITSQLVREKRIEGVTAEQLFWAWWFPLAAGAFDTTASSIAGGVRALLQHPEQLARLRADPRLIPLAIDEMVRWVSPVVYFRRTATRDLTFKGQHLRKGDKLVLCYASANRDRDVFDRPDTFDVGRTPNPHVSFGYGPHFCPGARFSMFVMRIFLEEFLQRMSDLQLDGDVMHTRSFWMNRIRSMPVAMSRRHASSS
jgi:cholest-4-en-3-one 26-monooxygenase